MLCASAAFAEEGVFDYTVFEENGYISVDINSFNETWNVSIIAWNTIGTMLTTFSVMGTLDGKIISSGIVFVGSVCDEISVLVDDTTYTFDTRMQKELMSVAGCAIYFSPETESFFQALAAAESVDIHMTTVDDEEIDVSLTGSSLEQIQFVLTEMFEQNALDCYTDEMQGNWEILEFLQLMTVD